MSSNNQDISILLATLRPDKARKCIETIAETSEEINYEVVVVSPLDMPNLLAGCKGYERIKFVREEKKEGCNKAFSTGYENAAGKYVLAMADDSLLSQDCLKNLLEFMRPHDHEIFLAGARFYDAYGPGPECKTYGFYYAFNPCIRRDLVEQIGGLYDLCYISYYGDPDLAMRVWHKGGKVELCPEAWVEFCNEYDDIDLEARTANSEKDFQTFLTRWHPIYGHLVNSINEKDINVCNNYVLPGLPPAKCTRLLNSLARQDWPALQSELEDKGKTHLNKDNLFYVVKEMTDNIDLLPGNIKQNLSKWLIYQLFNQISLHDRREAALKNLFEIEQFRGANLDNGDSSSVILASVAMFVVSGGLKRYPELVVKNYKGINIFYSPRKYYAWPCSSGNFSIDAFNKTSSKFAFCESSIHQIIFRIEELIGDAPLVDWNIVRDLESNITSYNIELFQNDKLKNFTIQKLPDEICLNLVLSLQHKNLDRLVHLLNTTENLFILRSHICFVYDELLRNIKQIPPDLALELSHWIFVQF